jgi:hypothetical protein
MADLVKYPAEVLQAVYKTHRHSDLDKVVSRIEQGQRRFYGVVYLCAADNSDRSLQSCQRGVNQPIIRPRIRLSGSRSALHIVVVFQICTY